MASLSRVTDLTRKVLEWAGILTLALILLVILFRVGSFIKDTFAPTPPSPPTVAFGKIPLQFFPINTLSGNFTYSLNTLTGSLPNLPDRINVYKIQQPQANLLNLDKAKNAVKQINFLDNPIQISDTTYRWTKSDPLPTTLTLDTQSFDFQLTSDYLNNDTVKTAANLPDENTARQSARSFFDTFQQLPTYIDANKTKSTLWTIKNGSLFPATSLSNAQIIRVDYFPKNLDTLPIYTAIPDDSLIYVLLSSSDITTPWIVEAQYFHKETADKATYPIKTSRQALDDLKNGKGYIAANPSNATNISIENISLGYFVDTTPQKYLWPIIIFQGDKGFFAYVSALQDEWISK